MAKKKEEQQLQYLQMPIPVTGGKTKTVTKTEWTGLNKSMRWDTGVLFREQNISTKAYPYLIPSERRELMYDGYGEGKEKNLFGLFGFDDFLLVIYQESGSVKADYLTDDGERYTGTLVEGDLKAGDKVTRCVVPFNVYDNINDPLKGSFVKKLLIFPDCMSMFFDRTHEDFLNKDGSLNIQNINTADNAMPPIQYATVHLSRLFGVDESRVYASAFNDYSNWTMDNAEQYNEANAWCTQTQSNTKADGAFTGITTFGGHVVCFKKDYMHEIYNTKNPFRLYDIYPEGAIDNRTIQDVDGKLIFVSADHVKVYTGGNPKIIDYPLGMEGYTYAVSGTDGRRYYLYCEDKKSRYFYCYDTWLEQWAEEAVETPVVAFAHNEKGMYLLSGDGGVYRLDTGRYDHAWSFETAITSGGSIDILHIRRIQLYAEARQGAYFRIHLLYDNEEFSDGVSQLIYDSGGRYGAIPIRVKPRNTANYGFRLRFEGRGYVKFYQMGIEISGGGELYRG